MRVHLTHLGCKLNQAEIERLGRQFEAAGHRVVGSLAEADLHIVNSCTVTHIAARESRKAAGRGRKTGRPVRTVLTGCYASGSPEEAARLAGVDLVVPNTEKDRLVDLVHAAFPEADSRVPCTPQPGLTRALVKVEDGCNMRCSFCIIPFTRGAQRSRPAAEVVAEVRELLGRGHQEIVITGVQISAWRSRGGRLGDLVRAILDETEVPRLRLTSIAPWDLDERLLDLWRDRRLCRHLHLSLQSGATATLRRMRRPYTAEAYLALLGRVRAAVPGVAVTTDVIVGFPGETDEEFAESLATVETAGFARIHVFPYSPRPGTTAEGMPDQVPLEEKKERMERMLAAAGRAERAFRTAHLGTRQTVLWERPKDGLGHGLTDNYLRVLCPEGAGLWNRFSEVEVVGLAADGMWGEVVA
ncbi:MAG TPA: tRNA (N(6)-L-threonylcarbamoyladenosine(37)-C(2))-methylthiotransferase MtaB [Thermoanaerobaculia bacterium]|jgi:threonylcarbamoyladenosine tRNA methylthiotransferase MtaB